MNTLRLSARNKGFRRGLTLIELVVVMALVGFLFTIVAVSLKNFFLPSARDTAEEVVASLRFARNHAMLNHKTVVFELDMEKGEYRLFRIEREEEGIREVPVSRIVKFPYYNKIFSAVDVGGRVTKGEILRIPFAHDGSGEDYTLLMGEEGNVKKSIQIFRYSADFKILDGEQIRLAAKILEKVDYGVDERTEAERPFMERY